MGKRIYFVALASCVFFLLALILYVIYDHSASGLEELKSRYQPHPDKIPKGKQYKYSAEQTLEIEEWQQYIATFYDSIILCLVLAVVIPIVACVIHSGKEFFKHFPDNLDIGVESCRVLRPISRFISRYSRSDEDTASQMARDVSANYRRTAARESFVLRRTRSDRNATRADLPGVPST